MLYSIAHFFKDKLPFIWHLIESVNMWLFSLRYCKKIRNVQPSVLQKYAELVGFSIVPMEEVNAEKLVAFFAAQPAQAYEFFKPHGFDIKSIKKLQNNKAFLAYILLDKDVIAGYCFIRGFFHGKGFRGRMVDINYRKHGLGTIMNCMMNEIGFGIGLRLFETVSVHNVASYRSAKSASNVNVVKEMEDGYLYLEILND